MIYTRILCILCSLVIFTCTFKAEAVNQKKAYIITGSESSGGRFISRVIAYAVGKDKKYCSWSGIGQKGKIGDNIVILHRSQPYLLSKIGKSFFLTLQDIEDNFKGYKIYYIITTRDKNIVNQSKTHTYNSTFLRNKKDYKMSKSILSEIIQKRKHFIWSYETYQYLGQSYLKQLYKFLGVSSNFSPPDVFDGNKKYIK